MTLGVHVGDVDPAQERRVGHLGEDLADALRVVAHADAPADGRLEVEAEVEVEAHEGYAQERDADVGVEGRPDLVPTGRELDELEVLPEEDLHDRARVLQEGEADPGL